MEGLLFLFGLFLALGLFFLTASVLKLPTMGAAKAMLGTVKQERKAAKTLETYFMILAVRLSGFIRMDAYKRSRMQNVLKASGMNMTPGSVSGVCSGKIRRSTFGGDSLHVPFSAADSCRGCAGLTSLL